MIKKIGFSLVACLLFLGAWKLAQHGLWERRVGTESLSWSSVEGAVTKSELVTSGSGTGRSTRAEVQYAYTVGGTEYQHDRIRYGAHGGQDGAGQWGHYGMMALGEPVTVYFDPQDPQEATLETGATGRSLGLLAAAAAIALFGAILVRVGFK